MAALEAAARMADVMGDDNVAAGYRKIRESGRKLQNEKLWNGEYYIQEVGPKRVAEVVLSATDQNFQTVRVERGTDEVKAEFEVKEETLHVRMSQPIWLKAGQRLKIEVS